MNFFKEISSNYIFWTSVFACFLAQVLKIFTGEKKVDIARIFTSGGMPSSHSSFVTCMATMIGIKHGFNSTYFAMAAVLSAIVMYDASGVRQAVGKQATMLNQIIEDLQKGLPIKHEKLKELIGHTPKQVFFGAILGIIVGVVM
ncbi:divergent PAP2 family protein [Peptostreptococcus porci]|uniref:divergent PAP2 family protein n=1 Tax=Peptostreptococcus porci TaxID=2652282 RepID=UPI002A9102CD|nr:divergent PAP2 family protein [Peptostreptococcus porci]MDY5436711.1 divergent PAP2 family protein [Peptostreptococcus porci]MDY6232668.1 divergent PAP2 family protein [Peptostreptococcus porci]